MQWWQNQSFWGGHPVLVVHSNRTYIMHQEPVAIKQFSCEKTRNHHWKILDSSRTARINDFLVLIMLHHHSYHAFEVKAWKLLFCMQIYSNRNNRNMEEYGDSVFSCSGERGLGGLLQENCSSRDSLSAYHYLFQLQIWVHYMNRGLSRFSHRYPRISRRGSEWEWAGVHVKIDRRIAKIENEL